MTTFKVGDCVRIIPSELDGFVKSTAKKLGGRTGVVVRAYTPMSLGVPQTRYIIRWLRRTNRGSEFMATHYADYLELAPEVAS